MKSAQILSISLLLFVSTSIASAADSAVQAALRYALGAFNPTVTAEQQKQELLYIQKTLLAPDQCRELEKISRSKHSSEEARRVALQHKIAEFAPISFITMWDGTTYWESRRKGQWFDWQYFSDLRGTYEGEELEFKLEDMKATLHSVEWSDPESRTAVIVRRDGQRFVLKDARLYGSANRGHWWCSYYFRNPITGKEQRKSIFDNSKAMQVKRIVFGLRMPKMNAKTKAVYPGDFIYDPYDGSTLVPAQWKGSTHSSK